MSIQVSHSTIPNPDELGLTLTNKDAYLAELLTQCQGLSIQVIEPELATLVQELRDRTSALLDHYNIPTLRDEEWRFTDLSSLRQVNFKAVGATDELPTHADITPLTLPEAANSRLVFVNGVYAPHLSAVTGLPDGVVVSNLAGLPITHRSRVRQ